MSFSLLCCLRQPWRVLDSRVWMEAWSIYSLLRWNEVQYIMQSTSVIGVSRSSPVSSSVVGELLKPTELKRNVWQAIESYLRLYANSDLHQRLTSGSRQASRDHSPEIISKAPKIDKWAVSDGFLTNFNVNNGISFFVSELEILTSKIRWFWALIFS